MKLFTRLRRFFVYTVCVAAIFSIVGCVLYPMWWYAFLWQSGFEHAYNYTAIVDGAQRSPIIASAVLVLIAFAVVALYRCRSILRRFVDSHGSITVFLAIIAALVAALLLNAIQRKNWRTYALNRDLIGNLQKAMEATSGFTDISFDPPISFTYLDSQRVDALFLQTEPNFVEKARTETVGGKRSVQVGIGSLPISSSAEATSEGEAKREFQAATSSPERRTLQLIQYCLSTGRAALLRNQIEMELSVVLHKYREQLDKYHMALEDPINPAVQSYSEKEVLKPFDVALKEAERVVAPMLWNPPEFVLVVAPLSLATNKNACREYSGILKRRNAEPITVTVLVPTNVVIATGSPPIIREPRVFGHVETRPTEKLPNLTVRAIAIF